MANFLGDGGRGLFTLGAVRRAQALGGSRLVGHGIAKEKQRMTSQGKRGPGALVWMEED